MIHRVGGDLMDWVVSVVTMAVSGSQNHCPSSLALVLENQHCIASAST
jgi:hypothetical protein